VHKDVLDLGRAADYFRSFGMLSMRLLKEQIRVLDIECGNFQVSDFSFDHYRRAAGQSAPPPSDLQD